MFADHIDGSANGTGSADHVVEDECCFAFDGTTDQVLLLCVHRVGTSLVHDGQRTAKVLDVLQRSFDAAFVGAHDDQLVWVQIQFVKPLVNHRGRVKMINRHVEEPLNLRRVQVHCEHTVSAGFRNQIRNQLRSDWNSTSILPVLPRVAEVGDDRRDPFGTRANASVDHDQQFHQVLVDGRTGGLDEEHVAAANVLVQSNADLTVREIDNLDFSEINAEVIRDFTSDGRMSAASQNRQVFVHFRLDARVAVEPALHQPAWSFSTVAKCDVYGRYCAAFMRWFRMERLSNHWPQLFRSRRRAGQPRSFRQSPQHPSQQ